MIRRSQKPDVVEDAAGNLQRLTNGALVRSMGVNALNQLTEATRSGTLTVAGYTTTAATDVTVNGSTATQYVDQTFASAGHSLTDGVNTFTAIAQAAAGRKSTNVVAAYLPATGGFSYDLNGNLLSDGLRAFDYDDENQLIRVLVTNAWKSEFVYDGRLRRRVRKEYTWQSNAWVQTNEVRYVYDGNLVIQERHFDPQQSTLNPQLLVTYTRGNDLSGTLEGAGGIGGLLAQTRPLPGTPPNYYYQADANGNIVVLINTNGLEVARYVYDPYGNVLGLRGNLAELNLYRFSSKEAHPNSGLVYYLYRYYEPTLQRWINRDPVEEEGGFNLYAMLFNDPVNRFDFFGLWPKSPPPPSRIPGGPWTWYDDLGNSRGGIWRDTSGRIASWDPKYFHWDVNDPAGKCRIRYNRHGAPMSKVEAHSAQRPTRPFQKPGQISKPGQGGFGTPAGLAGGILIQVGISAAIEMFVKPIVEDLHWQIHWHTIKPTIESTTPQLQTERPA